MLVLNLLHDRPRTVRSVTEELDEDRQRVRSAFAVLARRGRIVHGRAGRWKPSR